MQCVTSIRRLSQRFLLEGSASPFIYLNHYPSVVFDGYWVSSIQLPAR